MLGLELELIVTAFKAISEAIKGTLAQEYGIRSARSDTISPDLMNQYNNLSKKVLDDYPEVPIVLFKNIENPTQANYPKAIEVLGQIKIALKLLEKEISPKENNNQIETAEKKPKVFIGCSVEGLAPAKIIQLNLEHSVKSVIWSQGIFGLSSGTLETLTNKVNDYNYAILVLTPDDLLLKREKEQMSARDNVLFELGLFMGALGRLKTFIVAEQMVVLPTDLAGITPARFKIEKDENIVAALGPVCTKLELEMGLI